MTGRRILVVNPGADVYGSDLQVLESITAMVEAGWTVDFVAPNDGPLFALVRERGGEAHVMAFPIVRRAFLSVRGILHLAWECGRRLPAMVRRIRHADVDLVYVNTTTVPWWILAARLSRVPVVCHIHEAEDADRPLVLKMLNAPLFLADRLILISSTAMEALRAIFNPLAARSTLVHNGVPDRQGPPTASPPVTDGFRLCAVARLSPRKAPHIAIAATAELRRQGRDVRLELAGTHFEGYGWYVDELHRQVEEARLQDRVEFTGYVSPPFRVFDRSHVVLAPSLREPFGNSVVEAQLCERPVVAAAAGGHLETILDGETGVLVPPEDPTAMAAAIARLLDDETLRRRLSVSARKRALDEFGISRYRRAIRAVLEDQFRDRRRRGPAQTMPHAPGRSLRHSRNEEYDESVRQGARLPAGGLPHEER